MTSESIELYDKVHALFDRQMQLDSQLYTFLPCRVII